MKHLRCFPVLIANVSSPGGLFGVRSTCMRLCALACVLGLCWPAIAQTATTTTLTLTSGGSAVTTIAWGAVVTLTATVTAASTPVTPGTVNFCDASAAHCTDIHIVGSAQLTSAGTAVFKLRPGVGSHSYKAVFVGTKTYSGSSSGAAPLTGTPLAGASATTTAIAATETNEEQDLYTMSATVTGTPGYGIPTGTMSFLDASNGNSVLGTANLGPESPNWLSSTFPSYPGYLSGGIFGVTSADFNGDGIPDLAFTDFSGPLNSIIILIGNGDGTFTPAAESIPTGIGPDLVVAGDFNGDGIPDLAYTVDAVDESSVDVVVLLGNGDGSFTQKAVYPVTPTGNAGSIVAADFNQDGILDLAITDIQGASVKIFLGDGDGTFTQTNVSPSTGTGPTGIAVADFNGDDVTDLAVTNYTEGTVTVLLGNGDGTFTSSTVSGFQGQGPFGIVAADFNGDGDADLAIANAGDGLQASTDGVSILIGDGHGAFTSGEQPQTIASPSVIAVADFTGNGIPDLAVAAFQDSGENVTVLLGNGEGSFTPALTSPAISIGTSSLAVADFNGDGVSDLALANDLTGNDVSIVLTPISTIATATGISPPAGGDIDVEADYSGDSKYSSSISGPINIKTGLTALATIISPTPGTVLNNDNKLLEFEWTAGTGVTVYQLFLGTTGPGSSDVVYTGYLHDTNFTVYNSVPAYGQILYARLDSYINGAWLYNDYLYTESPTPVPAVLTSPKPGLSTVLGTSNVTFQWNAGTGIDAYELYLGTTGPGSSDLFDTSVISATSVVLVSLPANGKVVYARLNSYSGANTTWLSNDYVYTESSTPVPAVLTSPTPGLSTVLGTSNVVFQWTPGTGVALYQLSLGTIRPGAEDLYLYKGTGTSATVPSLPANGVTVYATLSSYINGAWQQNNYLYTESGTLVPAVLTSPAPGLSTVLGTSDVTFQWTTGTGANLYQLNLSATVPGGSDLYLYKGTATSTTVPSIPANGAIVYARLYSSLNGKWIFDDSAYYSDYVYTESGSTVAAILTFPSPGLTTVLGTSDVLFQWTEGAGATLYQLNLSAITPGGEDLYVYKGTATSTSAPSLPANGVKVYARLYSYINKAWRYNDYLYTEQ